MFFIRFNNRLKRKSYSWTLEPVSCDNVFLHDYQITENLMSRGEVIFFLNTVCLKCSEHFLTSRLFSPVSNVRIYCSVQVLNCSTVF